MIFRGGLQRARLIRSKDRTDCKWEASFAKSSKGLWPTLTISAIPSSAACRRSSKSGLDTSKGNIYNSTGFPPHENREYFTATLYEYYRQKLLPVLNPSRQFRFS